MLQAREHVIGHFRPIFNAHGITEQQWRIVRLLLDTGRSSRARSASCAACRVPALPGCCRVWRRSASCGATPGGRPAPRAGSFTPRSRALAARMAPQIEAVYARIEELLGEEFCG